MVVLVIIIFLEGEERGGVLCVNRTRSIQTYKKEREGDQGTNKGSVIKQVLELGSHE